MYSVFSQRFILSTTGLLLLSCSIAFGQTPELHQRLAANRAAIAKAKQQLTSDQKRSASLGTELQTLKASIDRNQTAIQAMATAQADLRKQYDETKQHAEQLQSQATSAKERRDGQAALVEKLDKQLFELEEQLLLTVQNASQAQRKLATASGELKAKQTAVDKAATVHKKASDTSAAAIVANKKAAENEAIAKRSEKFAQQTVKTLLTSIASTNEAVALLKKTDGADLEHINSAVDALQKSLTAANSNLKKTSDTVTKTAKDAVAAKSALAKAAAAAVKPATALKNANDAFATTDATIRKSKQVLTKSAVDKQILNARLTGLRPSVQKARLELERLNTIWVDRQKQVERSLKAIGQFVSFSNEVAPIFNKRCVACHNSRDAGGQFNMESMAAMLKGGESGKAFEAGHSSESYLVELIKEGDMPQEADPLSKEEITLIQRWIDLKTPLDAGIQPTARLIEIVPKEPQPLPPTVYKRPIAVTAMAFSPDGKTLATSGFHEVLVWNAGDGTLIRRITNVAERIHEIEFSQDGTTLAVAAGTPAQVGEAKLFGVANGKLLHDFLRADDSAFTIAFSPDETRLAVGSADNHIRVFEIETGEQVLDIDEHSDWVMDVTWSDDGRLLASASRDKTAKLFDASTGNPLRTLNGHTQTVYSVSFASNDNQLVTGSGDRDLRVWKVDDGKVARRIRGFGSEVFNVLVTPDGQVASVSADTTARLHDLKNGKEVRRFSGHTDWVYSMAMTGERLATGGYDGEVRVWNLKDGKQVLSFSAQPKGAENSTAAR